MDWVIENGNIVKMVMISVAFFIALGSIALAAPTLIKASGGCDLWGNCMTIVALDKETSLDKTAIEDLKKVDLTSSKPTLDSKLSTFDYKYVGSSIVFTGKIKQNTYWEFDLGNGYIIDPWWNYTTYTYETTGLVIPTNIFGANDGNKAGAVITMKNDTELLYVYKDSSDQSTNAYLQFLNGTAIDNAAFVGRVATFSSYPSLSNGETYIVYCWNGGASRNVYRSVSISIPNTTHPDYNIVYGTYNDGSWHNDSYVRCVDNITTRKAVLSYINTWYVDNLFLNGNESNVSYEYGGSLNATAITNLTGLPVQIYIDDILSASGTDSVSNVSSLGSGLHNITGWYGNASTNESITWFAFGKYDPNLNLYLNGSQANKNYAYGNITNMVANNTGGLYVHILHNGTDITGSPAISSINQNELFGVGYHNITAITNCSMGGDCGNYTDSSMSFYITITQADPNIYITSNTSSSISAGTPANITCNLPSEPTANLYNDTAAISNPYDFDTTGLLGTYNFTCNSTATQNYTAGSDVYSMTITSGSGLIVNVFDEENTTLPLTFNITINNGTASNTAYDQSNPYLNSSIIGTLTIDISSGGYGQRTYYNDVISGNTTNLTAFLLATGSGTNVLFYTYTTADYPIEDCLINTERLIPPSSWLTIAQKLTDVSGLAQIFLSPTTTYRFNVSCTGYNNRSFTLQPYGSPYVIVMSANSSINVSSQLSNLEYWLDPLGSGLLAENNTFNFTITSSLGELAFYGLNITAANGTSLYFSNSTTAAGGEKSSIVDLSAYNGTQVYLNAFFKKTAYDQYNINKIYYIYDTITPANTSLVSTALYVGTTGGLDQFAFGIISLFIVLIAMGLTSQRFSFGGAGIVGLIALGITTYIGILIYGLGYWMGWNLLFGLGLAVVGMLYLRSGV